MNVRTFTKKSIAVTGILAIP